MENINQNTEEDNPLESAPILGNLRGKNPFSTPNHYFDELPESVESHAFLSRFSEVNPFEIPNDYFERLPHSILEKIHAKSPLQQLLDQVAWLLKPRIAIPVAFMLFIGVFTAYYYSGNKTMPDKQELAQKMNKESLPIETLNELPADFLNGLDESALMAALSTNPNQDKETPENSAIENYLLDNMDASQMAGAL